MCLMKLGRPVGGNLIIRHRISQTSGVGTTTDKYAYVRPSPGSSKLTFDAQYASRDLLLGQSGSPSASNHLKNTPCSTGGKNAARAEAGRPRGSGGHIDLICGACPRDRYVMMIYITDRVFDPLSRTRTLRSNDIDPPLAVHLQEGQGTSGPIRAWSFSRLGARSWWWTTSATVTRWHSTASRRLRSATPAHCSSGT